MSGEAPEGLPPEAYAVALASMPSMGPARLRTLLEADPPARAWAWANEDTDGSAVVERAWQRQTSLGIRVLLAGQPWYPARLADDPRAPAVLFCLGNPAVLTESPTAALVGTRARPATALAWRHSSEPTSPPPACSVVSGLALGIDGAAHEGACGAGAPPIAVVAGGLDHVYPRTARATVGAGGLAQASSSPNPRRACPRRSGASRCATDSLPP